MSELKEMSRAQLLQKRSDVKTQLDDAYKSIGEFKGILKLIDEEVRRRKFGENRQQYAKNVKDAINGRPVGYNNKSKKLAPEQIQMQSRKNGSSITIST